MSAPAVHLPPLDMFPGISIHRESEEQQGWTKVVATHEDPVVVHKFMISLQVSNRDLDFQMVTWPEPTSRVYKGRAYFRHKETS